MVHNRNKLIRLVIGHISNAVVHKIPSEGSEDHRERYEKEYGNSFRQAKRYREKINPKTDPLPIKDQVEFKKEVCKKAKLELLKRKDQGYRRIDAIKVNDAVVRELKWINLIQ